LGNLIYITAVTRITLVKGSDDMIQPSKKVDVTSKVYGKMDTGNMSLYLDKQKIGQIVFTDQGNMYEMGEDFEFDQDKIYRYESDPPAKSDKYVDNCDIGWC
jgi:hypothetical protein